MENSEGHFSQEFKMDNYRYMSFAQSALPCKFLMTLVEKKVDILLR
jgi:hypothetical protein